jgi:4-hydroxy-3-methylbut-2-enyl diphosphate reductase
MTVTVKLARNSGYCFGVKRAIEMAGSALGEGEGIYSLGPLIHNPPEVESLSRKGIQVVESPEEVPEGAHLIIRSHGVGPEIMGRARERGLRIIDATCPLVKRAQSRAELLTKHGFEVVIIGERTHPEIEGILSYAPNATVIESKEDATRYESPRRIGVIAQTTQSPASFREILEILMRKKFFEMRIFNTICDATINRQEAALEVARDVDVMFVLGGHNSANTGRLTQMCAQTGVETHQLETHAELDEATLENREAIGVTAGASTPDWIIKEFLDRIRKVVKERYNEDVVLEAPEKKGSGETFEQQME